MLGGKTDGFALQAASICCWHLGVGAHPNEGGTALFVAETTQVKSSIV
jgi:hypothetical protein